MAKTKTFISVLLTFFIFSLSSSSSSEAQNVVKDSLSIFPKATEVREVSSLDGVWHFCLTNRSFDGGLTSGPGGPATSSWFSRPLETVGCPHYERMPVPSSFNDITTRREVRDFNGWVWYGRSFFVPKPWLNGNRAVLLRFGSVNYQAVVYVNGRHAVNHTGGHLPFQVDISGLLKSSSSNFISVAVNNVLSNITLPQGSVIWKNDTRGGKHPRVFSEAKPNFDFFNYAGIHRSVWLTSVPKTLRIADVLLRTSTTGNGNTVGVVEYKEAYLKVALLDGEGGAQVAGPVLDSSGTFKVVDAHLWWPFTMHPRPGYQYRLSVKLFENSGSLSNELRADGDRLLDSVYIKVGIRSLVFSQKDGGFLVNGRRVYFRGFGRHEESAIRGRSMDLPTILRDVALMKWMGANSFRTSHYPYAEEMMDEADEAGFLVFNESYSKPVLEQHLLTIRELVDRDKNRPSVVAWSIANEPEPNEKPLLREYFTSAAAEVRRADQFSKRPVTAALANNQIEPFIVPSLDFMMVNRYYAWYGRESGYVQVIQGYLVADLRAMFKRCGKLVIISEYGADTVEGMHSQPTAMFSEDFQVEFFGEYHRAFDVLRKGGNGTSDGGGFLIGEHVWNFADFMTIQGLTRVGGNKKGVFTRDRQPKTAARVLRCRYWALSGDTGNAHREGFSLCPQTVY
ncbi:hypothetical protein TYRP_003767 [Tyrophagus putrescentiae]|nr:hypothetical protein TYRP_003767 [Tyrophagus putrescentiae]